MSLTDVLHTVPFAAGAGLEIVHEEVGKVVVRIPHRPDNLNHLGTLHAAALVLVGETAGGLALFAEPAFRSYQLLAKGLDIRYRKPGTGDCNASAVVSREQVAAALLALEEVGKVDFPLGVEIRSDSGELLAEINVNYHLRKPR